MKVDPAATMKNWSIVGKGSKKVGRTISLILRKVGTQIQRRCLKRNRQKLTRAGRGAITIAVTRGLPRGELFKRIVTNVKCNPDKKRDVNMPNRWCKGENDFKKMQWEKTIRENVRGQWTTLWFERFDSNPGTHDAHTNHRRVILDWSVASPLSNPQKEEIQSTLTHWTVARETMKALNDFPIIVPKGSFLLNAMSCLQTAGKKRTAGDQGGSY